MPVMPMEILQYFQAVPCTTIVDGTAGGGGHTRLLQNAFPLSQILAFERDPSAAEALEAVFAGSSVKVFNRSYVDIPEVIRKSGCSPVSAVLLDLGLSSIQLDTAERGFSHRNSGPLDMRFNTNIGVPVSVLLSRMTEKQIADVIYRFGEEGRSRMIARAIKKADRMETTEDLAGAVRSVIRGNPVKSLSRVFQAMRIMVNEELAHLDKLLKGMGEWTATGSRVAVLTFHSIEDRMVKLHFRDSEQFRQYDPPWMVPSPEEKRANSRARSARLRLGVRT